MNETKTELFYAPAPGDCAPLLFNMAIIAFFLFAAIDFLIILFSKTMFNNSFNLLQIFIHMFGIMQLLAFKRNAGNIC